VLEQSVLLSGATIYMDYLRDAAIVEVQKSNVRVLEQTLKQTRDRFNVGEVTRTDVAQCGSTACRGKTQLLTAEANLVTTRANSAASSAVNSGARAGLAGRSLFAGNAAAAVDLGLVEIRTSPRRCTGSMSTISRSDQRRRIVADREFAGLVQQSYEQTMTIFRTFGASAIAQVSVPVYQGGAEYALIANRRKRWRSSASISSRFADCDPCQRCDGMGAVGGGQGAGRIGAIAGDGVRNRAQWRARRGQGRTADHARRAQRPAGAGQRPVALVTAAA